MTANNNLELYIHIPFCVKKCNYCDFLSFNATSEMKENYVRALISQIETESEKIIVNGKRPPVVSVYFGGGTPSTLTQEQLVRIYESISKSFRLTDTCEITIEVNPKTVDLCKLKQLKNAGFNRISIGMQSTFDEELKMLGRVHTYEEFTQCYKMVKEAGFTNINVDLMTALPNQSMPMLLTTLDRVIKLNPNHISAYSLILEEGTKFYEVYGNSDEPIVSEEVERQMYWECVKRLDEAGYKHYEISNFAKDNYESLHNSGYWTGVYYAGFGLGASSYLPYDKCYIEQFNIKSSLDNQNSDNDYCSMRVTNESDILKYINCPTAKDEAIYLSKEAIMDEFMFLGLRMKKGVNVDDFYNRFEIDVHDRYKKSLDKFIREGLLEKNNDTYRLTKKGIDYGNYVFAGFYGDL